MNAKKVESGSVDAISYLPDEILALILSFLPTKRAASTCLLSKRWRNLFSLMLHLFSSHHHLQFDDSDFVYPNKGKKKKHKRRRNARESFRALIDTTLSLNRSNSIKKFSLICEDDFDNFKTHTSRWISNVLERGVSDLDLRITMPLIIEPRQLYQCRLLSSVVFTSKTLVKLTLGTGLCIGGVPRPEVCLPVLKSLFLYTVWFTNQDFSGFLLRGCPVLEELYINHNDVEHRKWSGPQEFCHQTIKRITIRFDYRVPKMHRLSFNTPNLVYLDYSDKVVMCDYYNANSLHSLLEARLDLVLPQCFSYEHEPQNYSKFIFWICNVQILHLSPTTVEVMYQCLDRWSSNGRFLLFKNLVKLSFESKTNKGWEVLWSLIKNSPKLETLILKGFGCLRRNCDVSIDGNVLKVLEICGYRGTARELIQVKRFLCELEFLQVMKVEVRAKLDVNKKLQLTKDILALHKRSSKCQIYFL